MRRWPAIAVVVIVALAAAGCGSTKKPSSPASSGRGGGTFTYVDNNTIMIGWDPAVSYSNELVAMANMYEQLVRYDSRAKKVKPLLATSWKSENGGKRWTFTLREGVTFHTGRRLDAAAAKAALDRTIEMGKGAAYEWESVKRIEAPDARTLVFHLSYAAPLDLIASSAYAAYIYDTKAASGKNLGKWFEAGHEAGTGPYRLERWDKGRETEVRLKAYREYWGPRNGPHYDRVVFRVVPQDTTAAQLLRSGDATFVQRLTPQLWRQVDGEQGIATSDTPSFQNLIAMLNTASGPLKDERVRQAIAAAMDYRGLLSALKGSGVAAHGTIPEGLLGYDESLQQRQDPAAAKRLLEEAGYGPDGKPLKLELTHAEGDADQALTASILKSKLAPLNVELDVRPLEWTSQWDRGKSSDPGRRQDIFLFYWYPDYADPFSWFTNLYKSAKEPLFNLSYYDNAELDRRIGTLQQLTATDRPRAEEEYRAAQRTVVDDAVAVFLYVQAYQRAYRESFRGYVDNPAYANVVFVHDLEPTA